LDARQLCGQSLPSSHQVLCDAAAPKQRKSECFPTPTPEAEFFSEAPLLSLMQRPENQRKLRKERHRRMEQIASKLPPHVGVETTAHQHDKLVLEFYLLIPHALCASCGFKFGSECQFAMVTAMQIVNQSNGSKDQPFS
jgi:hypothetical protein